MENFQDVSFRRRVDMVIDSIRRSQRQKGPDFSMDFFLRRTDRKTCENPCGTVACIAGHALLARRALEREIDIPAASRELWMEYDEFLENLNENERKLYTMRRNDIRDCSFISPVEQAAEFLELTCQDSDGEDFISDAADWMFRPRTNNLPSDAMRDAMKYDFNCPAMKSICAEHAVRMLEKFRDTWEINWFSTFRKEDYT